MIITEQLIIDNKQFIKTYSDNKFMIERDNIKYSEAIDPAEFNRIYIETNIPIEEQSEEGLSEIEQKAQAWDILTGEEDINE